MPQVFIDGKDTVSVLNVNDLKRHTGGTFHRILIATGRAEPAVTAEWNEFIVAAFRTAIHSTTERRVTTMNHLLDVFFDSVARMKGINHFFIMVGKDCLENIHTIIMREILK